MTPSASSEPPAQRRLARYALAVDPAALPDVDVRWAQDVVLDTLGCALSGQDGEPVLISRAVLGRLGGAPQSTVIGTGERLPCPAAAWINGTMARYQDLNDTFPQAGRIGHFSEVIPTALAVGEQVGATGAEVLAAILTGYQVLAATTFHGPQVGVGFATFGAIAAPLVAGRLLGLGEDQLVSAVGLSLSSNVTLVTWLGETPGSMLKASTWSANAHHGILCALLAADGFTGPETAIETYLRHVDVSHPEITLPPPGQFTAPAHNMLKRYAAQMMTAGPIELVLHLAATRALDPAEIEEVVVYGTSELVRYAGGPQTVRPRSREAADHSAPYVVAIALLEGDVLPAQYAAKQWNDARVIDLMAKVTVVADAELDRRTAADGSMPARVSIRARGAEHTAELANPTGHPGNPMSSDEVEQKFRRLASKLTSEQQDAVVQAVAALPSATSIRSLLHATAGPPASTSPAH